MAKEAMTVDQLQEKSEKVIQEINDLVTQMSSAEKGSEAAKSLVKKYQQLLDRNTYLLVEIAKVELGVTSSGSTTGTTGGTGTAAGTVEIPAAAGGTSPNSAGSTPK